MCVNIAVQEAASEITAVQSNRSEMISINKQKLNKKFFFSWEMGITADKTYHVNTEGTG